VQETLDQAAGDPDTKAEGKSDQAKSNLKDAGEMAERIRLIRDRGFAQCRDRVLGMKNRSRSGGELVELAGGGFPFQNMAPDADSLVSGWFPILFVDDNRVPPDLPLKT